jgi:hypothetical protein
LIDELWPARVVSRKLAGAHEYKLAGAHEYKLAGAHE